MANPYCECWCHNSVRGEYNDAWVNGSWAEATSLAYHEDVNRPVQVPADDPLEAAVACDECRWKHVAVFTDQGEGEE